eukprot:3563221-Rhodomonas_salina.1
MAAPPVHWLEIYGPSSSDDLNARRHLPLGSVRRRTKPFLPTPACNKQLFCNCRSICAVKSCTRVTGSHTGHKSHKTSKTSSKERMGDQTSRIMTQTVGRDGVELRYEVIGPADGIPLVLTPGGQPSGVDHADNRKLAQRMAKELGFRCLLHDRVNNPGSSFFLGRERSKAASAEEAEKNP